MYDPRTDPKYKDNKLLLALTHQESRFNPNAVSPTGARGLTQVLPSTARSPGFGIAPSPEALTDPQANMAFGASYLDAMRKRYKGDNAAALVAYNGGPGTADKWVASGKNDKVLSKETSDYYKSVLSKAGEGYDFSKVKVKLPTEVDNSDSEETTGFAKLKRPGSKSNETKSDDAGEEEASGDESEAETKASKVKKAKASKTKDDEDDDEEDDDSGSKSGKDGFNFDAEAAVPKLTAFTTGRVFKPVAIQLGSPKLSIAPLEAMDDPRDR